MRFSSRIATSGPMISWTSPPEQKFSPAPVRTTALTSSDMAEPVEGVGQLAVGLEGQRVLPLRPVEGHRGDPVFDAPAEAPRPDSSRGMRLFENHPAVLLASDIVLVPSSSACRCRSRVRSSCSLPVRYCTGHGWAV